MKKKLLTMLVALGAFAATVGFSSCSCNGSTDGVAFNAELSEALQEKSTYGEMIDIESFLTYTDGAEVEVYYTFTNLLGETLPEEKGNLYFEPTEMGTYAFRVVIKHDGEQKELKFSIDVVPPVPTIISEAGKVLTYKPGDTVSFDVLYNASGISVSPLNAQIKFISVGYKEEVIDIEKYSSKTQTTTFEETATSYTFEKPGSYTFALKAVNTEGEVETELSVVVLDETAIPAGMKASGALFGANNDTVKLLKSSDATNMSYVAFDTDFETVNTQVRVEFLGKNAPQIVIGADQINGNTKEGYGYLATLEAKTSEFRLYGAKRTSSGAVKQYEGAGRDKLKKDTHYVWDIYLYSKDASKNKYVHFDLYQKNEDGSLELVQEYDAGFNYAGATYDDTADHVQANMGKIILMGSAYGDVLVKYNTPSANLLNMPEVADMGGYLAWSAVDGATAYEVKIDGEWVNVGTELSYDYSEKETGVYAVEVRAVFEDGSKSGSAYTAIYQNTLNLNALNVQTNGNTISWGGRSAADYTVSYEVSIDDGEWIACTDTSYTMAGSEYLFNTEYSFVVRTVYEKDGDKQYSVDSKPVTLVYNTSNGGIAESAQINGNTLILKNSADRTNKSYVAYEYGTEKWVTVDFKGKNMPTIRLLSTAVNGNTSTAGNGLLLTLDTNANLRLYTQYINNALQENLEASVQDIKELDDDTKYKLIYSVIDDGEGNYTANVYLYQVNGEALVLLNKKTQKTYTAEQLGIDATASKYAIFYGLARVSNEATFTYAFSEKQPAITYGVDGLAWDQGTSILSWTATEGAEGYFVKIGDNTEVEVTTNSYTVTGIADGNYTAYVYPKVNGEKGAAASKTISVGEAVNLEKLALSVSGNEVAWEARTSEKYTVSYQVKVNDGTWADISDNKYILSGNSYVLNEQYTVIVRVVYTHIAGTLATQYSEESDAAVVTYNASNATIDGNTITLQGSDRAKLPYVAYEVNALNKWITVDFTGKNMPTIRLATTNVNGNSKAGNGVIISTDISGLRVYKSHIDASGAENMQASVADIKGFDDAKNYRIVCSLVAAEEKYQVLVYLYEVNGDNLTLMNTVTATNAFTAETAGFDFTATQYVVFMGSAKTGNVSFTHTISDNKPAHFYGIEDLAWNQSENLLSWSETAGAEGYFVKIDDGEWTEVATNSYTAELSDGNYKAYVCPKVNGEKGASSELSISVGEVYDTSALTVTATGNSISWETRSGVTGYLVIVSKTDGTEIYRDTLESEVTSYDVHAKEQLVVGTNYKVSVQAIFEEGESETTEKEITFSAKNATIDGKNITLAYTNDNTNLNYVAYEMAFGEEIRIDFKGLNKPTVIVYANTVGGNANTNATGFIMYDDDANGRLKASPKNMLQSANVNANLGLKDLDESQDYTLTISYQYNNEALSAIIYRVYTRTADGTLTLLAECGTGKTIADLGTDTSLPMYVLLMNNTKLAAGTSFYLGETPVVPDEGGEETTPPEEGGEETPTLPEAITSKATVTGNVVSIEKSGTRDNSNYAAFIMDPTKDIVIEFVGKNMPTVRFMTNDITADTNTAGTGSLVRGDANNRLEIRDGYGNASGADVKAEMGIDKLVDGTQYKMVYQVIRSDGSTINQVNVELWQYDGTDWVKVAYRTHNTDIEKLGCDLSKTLYVVFYNNLYSDGATATEFTYVLAE